MAPRLVFVGLVGVLQALASLPTPRLDVAYMEDPRPGAVVGWNVSIIGFYYPNHEIKVDQRCGAAFLGNFWTPAVITNFAPPSHTSDPHTFQCSEACYWASQWWDHAAEFEGLNGGQVFDLGQKLMKSGVPADPSFGGFGNAWKMMVAILRAKFEVGSELGAALLATGDSYLVEHQEGVDSDDVWSDYCDGSGRNWLGMQLMLRRDDLRVAAGLEHTGWRAYIQDAYDLETGEPKSSAASWQRSVKGAAERLNAALPYICPPRVTMVL